jgi:hypothetical protein
MLKHLILFVLAITALAGLIIIVPLATIWSLNELFKMEIDFTLRTWAATAFLQFFVVGSFNLVQATKAQK